MDTMEVLSEVAKSVKVAMKTLNEFAKTGVFEEVVDVSEQLKNIGKLITSHKRKSAVKKIPSPKLCKPMKVSKKIIESEKK
jgi:uncharacterized protein YjgD (DUF1641 family)